MSPDRDEPSQVRRVRSRVICNRCDGLARWGFYVCAHCDGRGFVTECEACFVGAPVAIHQGHAVCGRCLASMQSARLPAPPLVPREQRETTRPARLPDDGGRRG